MLLLVDSLDGVRVRPRVGVVAQGDVGAAGGSFNDVPVRRAVLRNRLSHDRQRRVEADDAEAKSCYRKSHVWLLAPLVARILDGATGGIDAGARLPRAVVARVLHLSLYALDRLVERRDNAVH